MRKSRLSSYKQDRLMEHFVAGTTTRTAARLVGVHRNTATLYFHRLREVIVQQLEDESSPLFDGEVEVDESYFGVVRKGRRGRGAGGKVPVFGRLKHGGGVYESHRGCIGGHSGAAHHTQSSPGQYCVFGGVAWLQCTGCQ